MNKELFTQQEIAPKNLTKPNKMALGSDFSQSLESQNTACKPKKLFTTYEITLISVFMAMGIALNTFSSTFPKIEIFGRFSLIYGYCIISGIVLGALRGGICAALSDIVIALIFPENGMVFMPLITLSNFLMALIPGLIYRFGKQRVNFTLIASSIISFFVCTLGFTALGETLLYSYLGSAPFYPSVTALVQTGIPVYFAFVIRKAIQQPFWIILNLLIAKLILHPTVMNHIFHMKRKQNP